MLTKNQYRLLKAIADGKSPDAVYAEDFWDLAWILENNLAHSNSGITAQELYDIAATLQKQGKCRGEHNRKNRNYYLKLAILSAVGFLAGLLFQHFFVFSF